MNMFRNMSERKQYYFAKVIRSLMKLFWIFPIRKNKIFMLSGKGTGYSDSGKYMSQYLLLNHPDIFKIVWAVNDKRKFNEKGIVFSNAFSFNHLFHFCTAKVIVTNGGMPTYMPKRKGQYVINTWHGGGAYKRGIPVSSSASRERIQMNMYKSKCLDLFVSSCRDFEEKVIPDISQNYKGEILRCGLPRNDIFFSDIQSVREKVCSYFNLDKNNLLVLYAPTFRGDYYALNKKFISAVDFNRISRATQKRFAKQIVVAFRAHALMTETIFNEVAINVTSYPDMQELLCAADILISDYSSTIWDFSLTKKPCFLYCPDLNYYLNEDRGVYTPIETWPGILCRTNEELEQAILNFDEAEYVKKVEKHHKDMGSYETGHACEQVCKRIAEVCGIEEGL